MTPTELQKLIHLLQKLKKEQPQWISVCTVLALAQSLEALVKLRNLHKQKMRPD